MRAKCKGCKVTRWRGPFRFDSRAYFIEGVHDFSLKEAHPALLITIDSPDGRIRPLAQAKAIRQGLASRAAREREMNDA